MFCFGRTREGRQVLKSVFGALAWPGPRSLCSVQRRGVVPQTQGLPGSLREKWVGAVF